MRFKWQRYFDLRKAAAVAAALWMAFAHATSATTAAPLQSLEVTASLPMVGEWVKAVGGEHVRIQVIAPNGADPHSFEPSVRNIQAVNRSQVLFVIGMGLEPWVERLMRADPALKVVQLAPAAGGVRRIDKNHSHPHAGQDDLAHAVQNGQGNAEQDNHSHTTQNGQSHAGRGNHAHVAQADHSHDNHADGGEVHADDCVHGESDPHVWLDPLRVKEMVSAIEAALTSLAPDSAATFSRNADVYRGKLDALHQEIVVVLAPIKPQRRKLVTNHDNLYYFAQRYNFVVLDTLFTAQGASGGQPSARRVREIVARIKANKVEALLADAFSSRVLLEAVAMEAGMPAPGNFYSIPAGGSSPAPDYLQMMRHNAGEIAKVFDVLPAP